MRDMMLLTCLAGVLAMAGCKKDARMEPEPVDDSPRLGLADSQSQAVLVPEPEVSGAGYEQPYASRSWGVEPVQPSPTPVMELGRPQPTPAVQPTPQPRPERVAPAPLPVEMPQLHTVRKGETLWSIAKQHYGDGNRYRDILAANPDIVPEKLPVGETLVLP